MRKDELNQLPELLRKFYYYQTGVQEKSGLTALEYLSDLRSFFRFLIMDQFPDTPFREIPIRDMDESVILNATDTQVYEFLSFFREAFRNQENTRSRKVSSIRVFYKWLTVKAKLIENNPMEHLDSPKHKKSLPKYLSLDESLDLLRSIDGANRARDYCIITFFLNCGLRLSELVSLNVTDIRPDGSMKVTGKGNKQRMVYLNDSCMHAFQAYMKVRPTDGIPDAHKNALFISRNKKRISPKTVQHIVKTLLEKAGLEGQGYSTHKLRHTAATLLYQYAGTDVMLLKEMLGHESLSTTEIYTHVENKQLRSAVKASPLNVPSSELKESDE